MKKFIIRLLAVVAVLSAAGFITMGVLFKDQYKAAQSIHEVQNHLYELTYTGNYGFDELMQQGGVKSSRDVAAFATSFLTHGLVTMDNEVGNFGCSSLVVMGDDGNYRVGRNFDWGGDMESDVVIMHAHPENGYSSVSTFFINFLGFDEDYKPVTMLQRFMLVGAIYTPLDGMNEKGLYVADLMAGDDEVTNQEGKKTDMTTTTAIRLLLDRAVTTDEALALLRSINMHSDIGKAHHLAISDAAGKSVVVEWVNNQMYVAESPICTNHYVTECPKLETSTNYENSKGRFDTLQAQINSHPSMTAEDTTHALASVSGTSYTRWTIIYDRTEMTATYYQYADFTKPYKTSVLKNASISDQDKNNN